MLKLESPRRVRCPVNTPGTGMPPAIAIAARVRLGIAHWQFVKCNILQHQSGCFGFVT
jgi:hypothetical protein